MLAAFVKILDVDGQAVVYDVNTGELLDVDPALAAVLPLYGPRTADDIVMALADGFDAAQVRRAVAEIDRARREEGLFRTDRPRLGGPLWDAHDEAILQGGLTHLVLEVTEACNLRCGYCAHGAGRADVRPPGVRVMTEATALKALRWFAARCDRSATCAVSFYGGEPLLAPRVIRTVLDEVARQPSWPPLRLIVDTNGTLLDDAMIELVAAAGLYLQLSVDGPPAVHDRHRRDRDGAATLARIEAAITRLLARDPRAWRRLSLQATLAPPYDLPAVLAYFADFPPFRRAGIAARPRVRINVAELDGTGLDTPQDRRDLATQFTAAQDAYLDVCAAGRREAASPALLAVGDPSVLRARRRSRGALAGVILGLGGSCRPGEQRLHVAADGTLRICERMGRGGVIGDVDSGIVPELVVAARRSLRAALGERCADCWAVRGCAVCFRDAEGDIDVACDISRRRLAAGLSLYRRLLGRGETAWGWLRTSQER